MTEPVDPHTFFRDRLPADWNRQLDAQARAVEEAKRLLDGMRAVSATLRYDVRGDGGGTFYLNIAEGKMTTSDAPAQTPIMTLLQERADFDRLQREAGDSALSMLGGLAGLGGGMKLTKSKLAQLDGVRGCLRFEVTGPTGFALLTHFGPDPVPDEPETTLVVAPDAYADLRSGKLDPQAAFLGGKIRVEGNPQLAMQLALAALSPE